MVDWPKEVRDRSPAPLFSCCSYAQLVHSASRCRVRHHGNGGNRKGPPFSSPQPINSSVMKNRASTGYPRVIHRGRGFRGNTVFPKAGPAEGAKSDGRGCLDRRRRLAAIAFARLQEGCWCGFGSPALWCRRALKMNRAARQAWRAHGHDERGTVAPHGSSATTGRGGRYSQPQPKSWPL